MSAVEGGELAVVVGASGSFGTAIVDRLVGDGYAVLAGHPRPALKQLLREVAAAYGDVLDSPVERVQVWITEVDPGLYAIAAHHWGIGGVPASVVRRAAIEARAATRR